MSHLRFVRIGGYPPPTGGIHTSPPSLLLDSTVGTVTGPVLEEGTTYTVTVAGTISRWNSALVGAPEADAMYPTTGGQGRKSLEVGCDADTIFADPGDQPNTIGHSTQFNIDLGSGAKHLEPVGGPFKVPQAGHLYTFKVAGEGKQVVFSYIDAELADNYGAFNISVE